MAKDLLDFSKFKKIFEDEKNTHLRHPKGHTIIVAHVALSPKLKKQISDLPMHPEEMMEKALEMAEDVVEHLPHHRHKMAEGGEAKPFKGYNKEKHARTGGLNDEYREKYNREHGSNLKRPVTGKPEAGSKDAARKKSFCARMKGVKGPTSEGGKLTPKGAALKRWNCHAYGGAIDETDHDDECVHYAEGGNVEKPAVSRLDMHFKDVTKRVPELTEAANKILSGEMTAAEYDKLVNKVKPVSAYGFVPKPATREEAMKALGKKAERYGATHLLKAGDPADLRLDIPAYRDHGVWINSIHPEEGSPVYNSVSSVKNAKMVGGPKQAIKVAAGKTAKSPFAVISGEWNPIEEEEAVAKAQKYLKHPEWRQVGYDPERHGYFYDRETMHPIESAEEVLQIGPLVLAKKPVYAAKHEQLFARGGDVEMYAKGGEAARKAAKEYDWSQKGDLFRETPASMFDPEGRKLTKKAQEKKLFGPTGEPDPDTKQGAIYYANQQKAIDRFMESMGVPMVESGGKFQTYKEIVSDIKSANRKRKKEGLEPLPIPGEQEIQESSDYEKSPTTSTLRGAQFYRTLLQKANPKPDWRSGKLESQRNIGAKVHELGHIPLLPKNIPLGEAQEIMDEGSERAGRLVDPVTGESRQGAAKQIQEEIQSMAGENKFRNIIGIPAYGRPQYNDPAYGARMTPLEYDTDESGRPVVRGAKYKSGKYKGEYKEVAPPITSGSMPRISLDTQQPYATRLKDEAGELYDLIAQSKNMSPETRQRVMDMIQGITRMRQEKGTAYTPADTMTGDTLINLRGQGRTQEAEERLRTRGQNRFGKETKFPFAEGGEVPGKHLVHYSQHEEPLERLDPTKHGTGRAGRELRRGKLIPRTYYYEAGSDPETLIADSAKYRYVVPRPERILDLASEEARPYLQNTRDMNELEELLHAEGFHGYKNSAHPHIPNAVAVFHPQTPTETKRLGNYAEGGQVGFDAIKKERYPYIRRYADGDVVEPMTPEEEQMQEDPNRPLTAPITPVAAVPTTAPAVTPTTVTAAPTPRPAYSEETRKYYEPAIQTESRGRQFDTYGKPLQSEKGAVGAGQIMPKMAPLFAKQGGIEWNPDLFFRNRTGDPVKDKETEAYNLRIGQSAFDHLYRKFDGDLARTYAAYNLGEPKLNDALEASQKFGGSWLDHVPFATQVYVHENLARISGEKNPHEFAVDVARRQATLPRVEGVSPDMMATAPETAPAGAAPEAAPSPSATPTAPAGAAPAEAAKVPTRDPFKKQVEERYNRIVDLKNARMDPSGIANLTGDPSLMFGPNGEAPKVLDESAYEQAERDTVLETDRRQKAQLQAQQDQAENLRRSNEIRKRAGVPLLQPRAVPGATPTAGAPQAGMPAGASTPGAPGAPPSVTPTTMGQTTGPARPPVAGQAPSAIGAGAEGTPAQGLIEAYGKMTDAIRKSGELAGKIEQQQAKIVENHIAALNKAQEQYDDRYNALQKRFADTYTQLSEMDIDPMAEWNDRSVPAKIGSAIGLILGGIGGGLTKQENPALKFLQYQIEKSVEGMKMDMGRRNNLLTAISSQFRNAHDAGEFAKALLTEKVAQQLKEEALKHGGEMQKLIADKAVADLQVKNIQTPLMRMAFTQTLMNPRTNPAVVDQTINMMRAFMPEEAEKYATMNLPGYGIPTSPVDPADRRKLNGLGLFASQSNYLLNVLDQLGYQTPGTELAEHIEVIAHDLLNDLKEADSLDLTDGNMKFLEEQLKNPGSAYQFFVTNHQALRTTMKNLEMRRHKILSTYWGGDEDTGAFLLNRKRAMEGLPPLYFHGSGGHQGGTPQHSREAPAPQMTQPSRPAQAPAQAPVQGGAQTPRRTAGPKFIEEKR